MVFWVLLSTKQIWHIQTAWSRIIAESIHLHEPSWTNLCHFVTPNQSTNLCNLWTSRVFGKITCPNPHLTTKSGLGGWSQFFGWRKPLIEMHTPPTHLPMSSMMKRMSGILCLSWLFRYFSQAKSAIFWMQMSLREPHHPFGSTCHFRNRFFPPW